MKKKRILALISCLLIFLLCVCVGVMPNRPTFQSNETVLGVAMVDIVEVLKGKRQEIAKTGALLFEGIELPYDEVMDVYYLPQNMAHEVWEGSIVFSETDSEGNTFYLCASGEDTFWRNKQEAISQNHSFELYGVSKNSFCTIRMIVTGTPMILMETTKVEPVVVTLEENPDEFLHGADEEYEGTFCILDPGNENREYSLIESNVKFHKKGVSTRTAEKPSYSIKLKDALGNNARVSLLGLREGHSWKLNSLYTDENRIRERTASQIWKQLADTNPTVNAQGPNMEYVEVFLDGSYMGLYCLVEPVDEQQLLLSENEYLYKTVNWDVPSDENIQGAIDEKWNVCSSVRLRYPKQVFDYESAWSPIREYLRVFYREPELDYDYALGLVDMNNLADMMFFIMTVGAVDNTYKNMYFCWQEIDPGHYCMIQIPWDLDSTFGKLYNEELRKAVFSTYTESVISETTLPRFRWADQARMGDEVYERWMMQREGALSTEYINKLLADNRNYLVDSGAIEREKVRWNLSPDCMEIDFLLEFQTARMEWLDQYFAEWTGKEAGNEHN